MDTGLNACSIPALPKVAAFTLRHCPAGSPSSCFLWGSLNLCRRHATLSFVAYSGQSAGHVGMPAGIVAAFAVRHSNIDSPAAPPCWPAWTC